MNNTCNKTSNNKYFDCPARMDDGRTFTDYRPSYSVDDMIRYSNNVMGSYDYRQFLIHNADNIMSVNNEYTADKVGCKTCNAINIPFNTNCDINSQYSKCSVVDPSGVGLNNVVTGFNLEEQMDDDLSSNQIKSIQEKFSNPKMYASFKKNIESFNNQENFKKNSKMHPPKKHMESFNNQMMHHPKKHMESFNNQITHPVKSHENFYNPMLHPGSYNQKESFNNHKMHRREKVHEENKMHESFNNPMMHREQKMHESFNNPMMLRENKMHESFNNHKMHRREKIHEENKMHESFNNPMMLREEKMYTESFNNPRKHHSAKMNSMESFDNPIMPYNAKMHGIESFDNAMMTYPTMMDDSNKMHGVKNYES